jgi:putative alpha-1,2-mannosidase
MVPTSPMNNPGDYTEANAWQYTLTPALHDPAGLVALMGGGAAFEAWLDRFFSVNSRGPAATPAGPGGPTRPVRARQRAQPHMRLPVRLDDRRRGKGQALRRRQITRSFYSTRPDGITGNDDCGQMSAWLKLHVPSPDWRDQVIYFVMTDRFDDGDPSQQRPGARRVTPRGLKREPLQRR